MTWSPSSPVTGTDQTGPFTDPTFTLTQDVAPDTNGKQHAVTATGGTIPVAVRTHSVSDPFTVTFTKPKTPRSLQSANPTTGRYGSVPRNTYSFIVRKGVNFAANQAPETAILRCYIDVPAGADSYDPANVRAMVSLASGILNQQGSGVGDTVVNGIL
jgi:hypothetical protein